MGKKRAAAFVVFLSPVVREIKLVDFRRILGERFCSCNILEGFL